MSEPNKQLGQHWLHDRLSLEAIADSAALHDNDTVLEIGPGQGALTSELLKRAAHVVAVEFDEELARKLPGQFPGKNLTVEHKDILSFDLDGLPNNYVVVANVPYYITSKIIQKLMTASNKPRTAVLLVQKEVAQRIAAEPGEMSILAISAQVYAEATLGIDVPKKYFTPPPKVDSQAVVLNMREQPLIDESEEKTFFRFVKAGFSAKRKKLRSSLSGGLAMNKGDAEHILEGADISADLRAQDLSIEQWKKLSQQAL